MTDLCVYSLVQSTELYVYTKFLWLYQSSIFLMLAAWNTKTWDSSSVQFSSVAQSCPTLWPHESQHARPPCPSSPPRVHPNPCPLSWWCHPTISSSVIPFSSCPQSFPASESFPMSQLFTSLVAEVLEVQLQHQSFRWTPRTDLL